MGVTTDTNAITPDQERSRLHALLLEGAASSPTAPVDRAYFDDLRSRCARP